MRNLLIHAGILEGRPVTAPSRVLSQDDDRCFHVTNQGGLVDFNVTLGQTVAEGDLIARLWDGQLTGAPPREIRAQMGGIVIARHHPGLAQPGDCLAVLATELT